MYRESLQLPGIKHRSAMWDVGSGVKLGDSAKTFLESEEREQRGSCKAVHGECMEMPSFPLAWPAGLREPPEVIRRPWWVN